MIFDSRRTYEYQKYVHISIPMVDDVLVIPLTLMEVFLPNRCVVR